MLKNTNPNEQADIELVFCLDATGSMAGLIATAKAKIWNIVGVLADAQNSPKIRLGLIFYRDTGDAFVTKVFNLTDDIDGLYDELQKIEAQGGGDEPESVNSALDDAIRKMHWGTKRNVYRTVFLVGDCPPHMDYAEIKYPETSKTAAKNGIIINTIKLGDDCTKAIEHFRKIAKATNGAYLHLDQDASDVAIVTPFDDSISSLSYQIDSTKIYYGDRRLVFQNQARKDKTLKMYSYASTAVVSDRATYNTTVSGNSNMFGEQELINDLIKGVVVLEQIPTDELPPLLKSMNLDDREEEIKRRIAERKKLMDRLEELTETRKEFIRLEEKKSQDPSFSRKILKIMKAQAKTRGVTL